MRTIAFVLFITAGIFGCKNSSTTNSPSTGKSQPMSKFANVDVNTDSESEKFSYSMGLVLATTLKNSQIDSIDFGIVNRAFSDTEENQSAYMLMAREVQELSNEEIDLSSINQDVLKRAMYDVFKGDTTLITLPEVETVYQSFLKTNSIKVKEQNLAKGKEFLTQNATREGVSVTNSGLQHQIIEEGTGEKLSSEDIVSVSIVGKTINGEEVFDTGDQPFFVELKGLDPLSDPVVNNGLIEGILNYPIGSHFRLFIPSNLAFGEMRRSKEIGPGSTLIYEVKSIEKMPNDQKREYLQAKAEYMKQMQQMQQQQQR